MCCFDCELMPRLQHIRVAGKYFVDFEIPAELAALWRYMHHMYQLDAFTQSCPADQDIINHYKLQNVLFNFSFILENLITYFFIGDETKETRGAGNANVHDIDPG